MRRVRLEYRCSGLMAAAVGTHTFKLQFKILPFVQKPPTMAQLLFAKRFTPLESFTPFFSAVCAFVAMALMRHRIANPASGSLGSKRIAQG
jgi:hypothetical protein